MSKTRIKIPFPQKRLVVYVLNNHRVWFLILLFSCITFLYYFGLTPYSERFPLFLPLAIFEFMHYTSGSLYALPFLYSVAFLPWQGSLIVWSLCAIAILPRILRTSPSIPAIIINLLFAVLPLMVAISVHLVINQYRKEQESRVKERIAQRDYVQQIFKAQDDERSRIARELHDDTIQTIFVAASSVHNLSFLKSNNEINKAAKKIETSLTNVIEDLRRLTLDLSPCILDNLGLLSAIRWLADRLNEEAGIKTEIILIGEEHKLSPEYEVNIFRIIQEAMNNIRRHSHATTARVVFEFTQEFLKLTIDDNGRGFQPPKKLTEYASRGKMGLAGIQQRIFSMNGTINFYSQTAGGTTISATIKYQPAR